MKELLKLPLEEISRAGEARRLTIPLCRLMNFSEVDAGRVAIIVTEAATNLAKHAFRGELLIQPLECGETMGIEILSIDRGPGMVNPTRCLQDGFSTADSPGTGLGAMVRTSSEFDIFSEPDKGTVMMSRYWTGRIPRNLPIRPLEISSICLPITEEEPCGDGWAVEQDSRHSILLACDGLGHGLLAAEASREAERLFNIHRKKSVQEILETIHAGLRSTRGAALAVLEADHLNAVVRYCGIGNISSRIVTGHGERTLISHNGIVGHETRKIQTFTYPWDKNNLLIMHSDGIATKWRLADYPGLVLKHPSIIAGVLYRDFKRDRDDSTVVVAKKRRQHDASNSHH